MHGRAYKEYIFRTYNIFSFSAIRYDESLYTYQCEKEDRKA